MRSRELYFVVVLLVIVVSAPAVAQTPLANLIPYEGYITLNNQPVHGQADFQFKLFNQKNGGAQVGQTVTKLNKWVTNGNFSTAINFGLSPYSAGQNRWLEVAVRTDGTDGAWITLSPRKQLYAQPFALYSKVSGDGVKNVVPGKGIEIDTTDPKNPVVGVTQISTPHIADAAITNPKIGDSAISNSKIQNNAVSDAKISSMSFSKLTQFPGYTDRFLRGDGSWQEIEGGPPSGPAGGDLSGSYPNPTIANSAVSNSKIADLAVSNSKISDVAWNKVTGTPPFITAESDPTWAGANDTTGDVHRTGRVGIGTASPTEMLDVSGVGKFSIDVKAGDDLEAGDDVIASDDVVATDEIRAGNRIRIGNPPSNNDALDVEGEATFSGGIDVGGDSFFDEDVIVFGRVGINVSTTPTMELQVVGNACKTGGGSWATCSDVRLKKNICDLDNALEALLSLRGIKFEYIDPAAIGESEGQRVGLIAQEVEQVFPDWVETGPDGFKRVSEKGLAAYTAEALRELRAEKDAEILALQERVAKLESMVEQLVVDKQGAHR